MHRMLLGLLVGVSLWGQPSVSPAGIVNASGYQNKLAPDTVFTVFGSGLGPAVLAAATGPNYPETLAGTSIRFTPVGGGTAVVAKMVYAVAGQVAGLLPSSIVPGTYAVQVTYNGATSAAQNVAVVARSLGIATANSAGVGPAQATVGDVNNGISLVRYTTGSVSFGGFNWVLGPAHPGNTLVLWGTGGGADAANDTGGTSGDQTAAGGFVVTVGGRAIVPLYAGASAGYPGLWQINFQLRADIALDCYAPVQVTAGGEVSNTVTIAIAAAGQTACADPSLSAATLARLDGGGDVVGGAFGLVHSDAYSGTAIVQTQDFSSGGFYRWTAAQWAMGSGLRPRLGQCGIWDRVVTNGLDPAGPARGLDAGARLPLSGPGLLAGAAMAEGMTPALGPYYLLQVANGTFAAGGSYSTLGNGGTDVGAFAAVMSRMPDRFTVTNLDAIGPVDRTKALPITWTGAGFDHVLIDISSVVSLGGGRSRSVTISCDAPGAPGAFTIPASLMGQLLSTMNGVLGVYAQPNPALFTASVATGGQLDFGSFAAERGVSKGFAVQ